MGNPPDQNVQATVTRYTLARLQRIQVLIPIAIGASVLARRVPSILTVVVGLAVMLAIWIVLRDAVTTLGKRTIRVDSDALWIGTDTSIARAAVVRWTFSKGVASLLCSGTSYRLRSKHETAPALEASLRSLLGAPTLLRRRGSPTARLITACVMVGGLAAAASGIALESIPLVVIGIPSLLLGFAAFATLSSRVAVSQ